MYGNVTYGFGGICSKNTDPQGSTFSNHHMTTGFGSFELLTCGLLIKGCMGPLSPRGF